MVGLEQNATLLIEAEQDIPGAMLYQRPRVWELFRKARTASLVMVVANAGCGKTTATYQYMMQLDAPVVWFRFKDSDNNPQQFWEDYTASVETRSERYANRLRMCGFPDSDEKFDMYMRIQKDELAGVGKLVVVCDDYHNIKNGAVVRFLEKSAYHGESCIKRVLISRTEPVFSILEFFVKGKIVHITESDLAFTKDEIAGYYRMLGINIPLESVTRVHEETGGWAFAVALVGRLLEKSGGELAPAQYAYKANIVQMIDLLVSESLSNNLYRLLLKLSLIDGRNAELVRDIAGSDETMNELNDMTVFVRFDRLLQVYEIHAVLLDYLRERQDELTAKEKKRVYHLASEWFMKEGQTLNAAKCYARCGEWEKVVMIAKEMPQEVPLSIAETFLSLLEDCPPETLDGIPDYFPLRVRLLFCTGDLEKAKAECIEMIERFSAMPKKKVVPCMLGHLYFQLGTIAMMQAPEAETYDFAQYYEEGGRRLEGTRLCTTGLQNIWHIGAHSLLVGTERAGAVEEFLEQLKAIDAYSDNEFNGRISGLYELTLGEYCYYKGDMEQTLALARMAYQKAIESDQTIIQNRAIIGRVFAATALGDYEAIMRAKVDLDTQHEKRDSLYRTASYDVAYSSWCSAIGRPQDAAEWLKGRFTSDYNAETDTVMFEGFLRYAKAKVLLRTMQYEEVLYFVGQETHLTRALVNRIGIKMMEAISRYRLGMTEPAFECLREAYEMSRSNGFDTHFIRYGKDTQALVRAAIKAGTSGIPEEWLQYIYKKASIFVKRHKSIIDRYAEEHKDAAPAKITLQEKRFLTALGQGLSQSDAAEELGIAPRTARGMAERVAEKLGASGKNDALKIAKQMRII